MEVWGRNHELKFHGLKISLETKINLPYAFNKG